MAVLNLPFVKEKKNPLKCVCHPGKCRKENREPLKVLCPGSQLSSSLSHTLCISHYSTIDTHTHSHTPTPGPMHTTQPLSHKRCPLNPPI